MDNKKLFKDIENHLGKKLDKIIYDKIFTTFKHITKDFIQRDFYDMYTPLVYDRQYRLLDKWIIKGDYKSGYKIYVNPEIKGEWRNRDIYLVQIVEEGKIKRVVNGKVTFTPYPLTSKLREELRANKLFEQVLKDNGLKLK